jgi:phospholipase C
MARIKKRSYEYFIILARSFFMHKYLMVAKLFVVCFCLSLNATISVQDFETRTPIKYIVVIIPENASFDHLFSTYPKALNLPGEPLFVANRATPSINGLNKSILLHNTNAVPPFRLNRAQVATIEPEHHYVQLQEEAHGGLLDQFVQVNKGDPTPMAYFDGNTVTALWNYAQRFAISDNCYSTTMTPSTPGHINIVSGQTHGALPANLTLSTGEIAVVDGTLIADPDPAFDRCSNPPTVEMTGINIGDLLNAKKVSWGYFQGGFRDCSVTHLGSKGLPISDYSPHHQPFQYYRSTSNPQHLPPSSPDLIGFQDQANHQYDLADFWTAFSNHQLPAVSFLKPAEYQDGHPKYSDQLSLQTFLVETINRLQRSKEWRQMAIIVMWDDSGGWYDHVMPPIINQSHTPADALLGPGNAGNPPPGAYQGRLAYGNRIPFLLISPFAKQNFVDHSVIDQTSVLRFIEKNWYLGEIGNQSFDRVAGSLKNLFDFSKPNRKILLLEPETGEKTGRRRRDKR